MAHLYPGDSYQRVPSSLWPQDIVWYLKMQPMRNLLPSRVLGYQGQWWCRGDQFRLNTLRSARTAVTVTLVGRP